MARMLPDPTFYPSPKMAGEAPAESLAYVALLTNGQNGNKDALGVVTGRRSETCDHIFQPVRSTLILWQTMHYSGRLGRRVRKGQQAQPFP